MDMNPIETFNISVWNISFTINKLDQQEEPIDHGLSSLQSSRIIDTENEGNFQLYVGSFSVIFLLDGKFLIPFRKVLLDLRLMIILIGMILVCFFF